MLTAFMQTIIGDVNIHIEQILHAHKDSKWEVYTQKGPSDDTMLVCHEIGAGITFDDLFGYAFFPLPLSHLKQCGWVYVGDL